jgi:glycolate oxidase FAD binding subunit
MRLGNIPRRVDIVLQLRALARLIEHDDANLTATAEAGITLAGFQDALAERRQFLTLDAPRPARATLGGIAAANVNGPRRALYGGVRDVVIGMKMVLAGGEMIKSGGKVVKNVAGYDLAKLFIGSLGTLGVITELTFKLAPLPEAAAAYVAFGPLARCLSFVEAVSASPLLPSALTITAPADPNGGECRVVASIEGFEEAVARHLRDLAAMAVSAGLAAHSVRGDAHAQLCEEICGFGWDAGEILCRIVVPIGAVADLLTALDGSKRRCAAYMDSGTVWVLLPGDRLGVQEYQALASKARQQRGHAIIAGAPAAVKAEIDVWGEPPANLRLMREIKRQFDPQEILNPGRFIARL